MHKLCVSATADCFVKSEIPMSGEGLVTCTKYSRSQLAANLIPIQDVRLVSMNSCQAIRNDLANCLLQTDCVKNGKSGQECLRDHMDELPSDCQVIYKSYVSCKRGMLDMRKRFRGNAPLSAGDNRPPGATSSVATSAEQDPRDPAANLAPEQND